MKGVKGTKASLTPNIPKLVTTPAPKASFLIAKGLISKPKLKDSHSANFRLNLIMKGGNNFTASILYL